MVNVSLRTCRMLVIVIAFFLLDCPIVPAAGAPRPSVADRVDPLIGNRNGTGQTFVGPTLPHGSIHPGPDSVDGGQSGYKSGNPVRGFSQTHVSGIGWTTYGNLLLSPQVGLDVTQDGHDSPVADERARAYSYRASLTRYGITAEVAPTHAAAYYRFTFPAGDRSHLMLDLAHQLAGQIVKRPSGQVLRSTVTLSPDGRTFSGSSQYVGGWGAGPYRIYFHGQVDAAPAEAGTFSNGSVHAGRRSETSTAAGDRVGAWWRFRAGTRVVGVKLAISFRDVDRARANLAREIGGRSFAQVEDAARSAWDRALGAIAVAGGDEQQRRQFHTALYHAQLMPRDRTGEFARFAPSTPMWDDQFAVWDTWRTVFPLLVLIDPAVVRGSIRSFGERLRVDGHVRDSIVAGNGGKFGIADQGGNDIDNIIADAYVKGVAGIDWERAYAVLKFDADHERRGTLNGAGNDPAKGTDEYRKRGWIASGLMAVSNTLEYAYNDYNVAQVARGLGKTGDARRYGERSRQWRMLFRPDATSDGFKGFIMPRGNDLAWVEGVDMTAYPGPWKPHFYEGSTWNYSFFVPHQPARLIALMGGDAAFAARLEHGLQKGHVNFANEPAFLAPALFHYAGRPDLSARWVRDYAFRKVGPAGYPGDDDSGAMSSYYVWASLGLFPNAGQDVYLLNGPLFDRLTVRRPEEGKLTITRSGSGPYVAGVRLNGRVLQRSWLRHREIKGDTELAFAMSPTPTAWGRGTPPPSAPDDTR